MCIYHQQITGTPANHRDQQITGTHNFSPAALKTFAHLAPKITIIARDLRVTNFHDMSVDL